MGGQIPGSSVDQNDPPISTADRLATEFKVSPATVKRDGQYAAAVDKLAKAGIEPQAVIAHEPKSAVVALALAYPETEKGGRGKKLNSSKNEEFSRVSSGNLSMARFVLRNCRDKAMATAMAFPEAKKGRGNIDPAKYDSESHFSQKTLERARYVLRNNPVSGGWPIGSNRFQ